MKLKFFTTLIVPAFFWAACSSDSSSAPTDPQTGNMSSASTIADSTIVTTPADSSAIQGSTDLSSSSTENTMSSGNEGNLETDIPFAYEDVVYDSIGFADIGNAYHNVGPDEKVVFVLRHAERERDTDRETPLTEDGCLQAQSVGQKLVSGTDFVYAHTAYVRTEQTALNIAIGRGQTEFIHDTIPELTGGWFVKDQELRESYYRRDTNSNAIVALWAYDGMFADAFYDLEERSLEVIHNYLIKDYAEMPKAKVIISHDEFVVPLIAWATNKTASIRFKEGRWWINYLTGVAIIVNSNNEIRYIGIKGLDSATE